MPKRVKKEKWPVEKIDFMPYGAAIKAGRIKQKESRNKAANALFISPRYLANIENKGQHPSVQVFLELMSRYHILDILLNWSCDMNIAINNFSTGHHFKALHGAFPKFRRNCIYL